MAEMNPHDVHEDHNEQVHHEESDVNIRGILWFIGIFIAFAIVTHLAIYGVFLIYRSQERAKTKEASTLVSGIPHQVPPEPRLQPFAPTLQQYPGENRTIVPRTPPIDMNDMRERENRELTTWGWADQAHGVVRMPVALAMDEALRRGYPIHQDNEPAASAAVPGAAPVAVTPAPPVAAGVKTP